MKKTFFCMAMVICLCWAITVAFADATIICPEDGEILSVQDGMIHVEWDINGKSGEWVIISYTTYDTLLSDDIAKMFEQDGEAAYQLTELYTELQIEGLKRTGQFLQDYENARGLDVDEFGINDAQLKETLNGLDGKIEQMEDIHNSCLLM